MLASERHFVDQFDANFARLRNGRVPIVFYGIGEKTRLLLRRVKGYNLIGLMDRHATGKVVYGVPVLSESDVAAKARSIIIVANMSMAPLIYERIRGFQEERGIDVWYINGSRPGKVIPMAMPADAPADGPALKDAIARHDIVSFDLFDTLIMRRTPNPTDVFAIMERRLLEERQLDIGFAAKRIEAEHHCYRHHGPYCNLDDIYRVLRSSLAIDDRLTASLLELEIETELTLCTPRVAVIDCLRRAKRLGKTVLITTDTFWTRDRIWRLLSQCGVRDYDQLLISCEVRKLKYLGDMWEHVQELYPGRSILHVGDNPKSDVETAQRHGMSVFRVSSGGAMLSAAPLRAAAEHMVTLDDRMLLGQIGAELLNDPWSLHRGGGKLPIDDPYSLGYLCFGPLILNYLLWLVRESRRQGRGTLLFFARDGYILHRLYQKLVAHYHLAAPEPMYFLTSRRAASVAAIENEEDVAFILDNVCKIRSLRVQQVLRNAFGIDADPQDSRANIRCHEMEPGVLREHIVERYLEAIVENASCERKSYLTYINGLGLGQGDRLGCINFVGRGMTQLFVSRILQRALVGFYFAREVDMLDYYERMDDCQALYGDYISPHTSRSHLATKCIHGEIVLSSPDEQLIRFNEDGSPVYEQRQSARDVKRIQECHRGVERLMEDMMALDPRLPERRYSPRLVDELYGLFAGPGAACAEDVKQMFVFSDYYNPERPDVPLPL